jgi:hypothetical protein
LNLSDNLVHLIALIALLASAVILIIFGHPYINSDYVFGTVTTLSGALFGYRFGVGVVPPAMVAQIAQAQAQAQTTQQVPAPQSEPPADPIIVPAALPPHG